MTIIASIGRWLGGLIYREPYLARLRRETNDFLARLNASPQEIHAIHTFFGYVMGEVQAGRMSVDLAHILIVQQVVSLSYRRLPTLTFQGNFL